MGGKTSTLEFSDIADVLRVSRGHIAPVSTIANKLQRGVSFVQRALDGMAEAKMVEIVQTAHGPQYRLPEGVAVSGAVEPRQPVVSADVDIPADGDMDEDGDETNVCDGLTHEQRHAAALWAYSLGDRRWTDDPRAVRENLHKPHLLPPFLNQMAREI
jgi:hypothetical protein